MVFSLNRLFVISFVGAALVPTLASSASNARPASPMPYPGSTVLSPALATAAPAAASDDEVGTLAKPEAAPAIVPAVASNIDEASIECVAKIVRHEAANQSERGQLAVAQLVIARTQEGSRFGRTPCAVANQPGQFFNTAAYNPDRTSVQWTRAVAVSRDALGKVSPSVVPGALFYHTARETPSRFFRTRQRVAVLGDHAFYR